METEDCTKDCTEDCRNCGHFKYYDGHGFCEKIKEDYYELENLETDF
jgi:hypothetical protein